MKQISKKSAKLLLVVILIALFLHLRTFDLSAYSVGDPLEFDTLGGGHLTIQTYRATPLTMAVFSLQGVATFPPGVFQAGQSMSGTFSFDDVSGVPCKEQSIDQAALKVQIQASGAPWSENEWISIGKINAPYPTSVIRQYTYTWPENTPAQDYNVWGRIFELQSGDTCYTLSSPAETSVTVQSDTPGECPLLSKGWKYRCEGSGTVYENLVWPSESEGCPEWTFVKSCEQDCARGYSNTLSEMCLDTAEPFCITGELSCSGQSIQRCVQGEWLLQDICPTGTTCNADIGACQGAGPDPYPEPTPTPLPPPVPSPIPTVPTGNGVPIPTKELICNDAIDNDLDGFIDCNDPDCSLDAFCEDAAEVELNCVDNIDNDKDGLVDLNDPDCKADGLDTGMMILIGLGVLISFLVIRVFSK